MSNAPRTPDDPRNERQRRNEDEIRKDRPREDDRNERARLLEEKPFDFIERTKPEDRLDDTSHRGQLTRDNVNPNIPSVSPEAVGPPIARVSNPGGIVDPKTLGMESIAGVAPPAVDARHTEEQELALANHLPSINEPPGSNISTGDAGPVELPPLVLSDISPDTLVVGTGTFPLVVTGSGFTPESVVVFDDADVATAFVSPTELHADCPVSSAAEIVDVEVSRGDDMSDVLSFEFTAVARMSEGKREQQRKPKKDTPASKRLKKGKR